MPTRPSREELQGERRLLVDGKLTESSSGGVFPNIDPATEDVLGETSDATAADMDRAITAARRAFDTTPWAADPALRRTCLEQLRRAMRAHKRRLRSVVVAESGCPIGLTYAAQVDRPIADLDHWAALATTYQYDKALPPFTRMGSATARTVVREPVGVVGVVTASNSPPLLKLGPALAAGNAVVLKPSPDSPWSATTLGRIIAEETEFPPGIVNVVPSCDPSVGELLSTDPRIDMINFTGSTVTGRRVMAMAAGTVKNVVLELGGKSTQIVLDDVEDIAAVAARTAACVCMNSGQVCALITRLLLPRSRYDEGVAAAEAAIRGVRIGDPWDMQTVQGPLINGALRARVLASIATGVAEGGRLVCGGGVPPALTKGFFVEPTLFADVRPDATVAQEEIFGPVLVVMAYDDDDDAVRLANGTIFGLAGDVTGRSVERAEAIARRIRAGTVTVNWGIGLGPDAPFGGYGQSGVGRQNGIEGFEEYLETKMMAVAGR